MRRGLELAELIECWTLVGEELKQARSKRGVNALVFGLLLKFMIDAWVPILEPSKHPALGKPGASVSQKTIYRRVSGPTTNPPPSGTSSRRRE